MLKKKRAAVACVVWFAIILEGLWTQGQPNGERTAIFSNDYGDISASSISDGANASYLLHTFTLHPKSMLLPLILNSNMTLYVKSGRGKIGLADEGKSRYTDLEEGDVLRVLQGVVFFIYCHPKTVFPLQIHAIFINSDHDLRGPEAGPYASIQDLLLGFDKKALQPTFKVSVEVINQLLSAKKPPLITHVDDPKFLKRNQEDNILQDNIVKANIFKEDQDFNNTYGWFSSLSRKALNGSDVGFFMMNLTAGSMMEPNWNSMHEEVVVVLEGRGMVRVVCSEFSQVRGCSKRFEVREGDVFVVPRLHAKAVMTFDDEPLMLMGFARVSLERKEPQFLGGRYSVLGNLGIDVVAKTFNVANTTVAQLLAHTKDDQAQSNEDQIILACTLCAEEESQKNEQRDGGGGTELQENDHGGEFEKVLKI